MSRFVHLDKKRGGLFVAKRRRLAELRRVAHDRLSDPTFSWENFGFLVGIEAKYLPPGLYAAPGWIRPQAWIRPCVETALLYGASRVFDLPDQIPIWIRERVEVGLQLARLRKSTKWLTGDELAVLLRVTLADRTRLKLRMIGAADCPRELRDAARREAKRQLDRARSYEKSRLMGRKMRNEYEGTSDSKLQPWKIQNRSRRWFYEQPTETRQRLRTEALALHMSVAESIVSDIDRDKLVHLS